MVRDEARPGPQQQQDLVAARLDELDGAGVRDALRGLPVDLHNLVPDLHREQRGSCSALPRTPSTGKTCHSLALRRGGWCSGTWNV